VKACAFCGFKTGDQYAMTRCKGDPRQTETWSRHILPLCGRHQRDLYRAGAGGLVMDKATGEKWYIGHTAGLFPAVGR
jgi:hypothetical protein